MGRTSPACFLIRPFGGRAAGTLQTDPRAGSRLLPLTAATLRDRRLVRRSLLIPPAELMRDSVVGAVVYRVYRPPLVIAADVTC